MSLATRSNGDVPGPRGSRLLGMARALRSDQLGTYETAAAEYGDVVRLVIGPPGLRRVVYLVTNPDGVEQVLATDGYTKDTPYYEEVAAYLGNGLLTSSGDLWRQQRRTVAPLFTHRRIAKYVDVMADEAARMVGRWAAAASQSTSVDLDAEMIDFAIRTIGRILFGANVDDAIPVVQKTFPILNHHVRRRGLTPLRLPRRWPTTGQRRAARAQQALYDVVDTIIAQRRNAPAGGDDLISLLLAASDPETGAHLSAEEVRDQVLLFLLAGHETTSTVLTFTCQLLGSHTDVQRRVQREVDDVLAGRAPTSDALNKLTYTTMVINEAMRLYPPAYALGRVTPTGDRIGGYDIPPGSIIVLSPWATHRRPDLWPDPRRFDPERFAPNADATRPRYAHFPFAGGPRRCIGAHFAMTEAVTATAMVVATYTLRSGTATVPLRTDVTLHSAGPVFCNLTRRE